MTEVVFLVDVDLEGGYMAQAVGASIVTEAADLPALRSAIRDALRCHFDDVDAPPVVRLRFR